jgi:hypothetical protein
MPEPNYAGSDPPGFWGWFIGLTLLFVLLILLRGC